MSRASNERPGSLLVGLYRLALLLLPSDVRRESQDSIVSTFVCLMTEARALSGRAASHRLGVLEFMDVFRVAARLWAERWWPRRVAPIVSTVFVLCLVLAPGFQRGTLDTAHVGSSLTHLADAAGRSPCAADYDDDSLVDVFMIATDGERSVGTESLTLVGAVSLTALPRCVLPETSPTPG